jgi:type VI secretion system protein VasD
MSVKLVKSLGFRELALVFLATLGIDLACAHTQEQLPPCNASEPLNVTITAARRLNLGEKGEPLATVVRLYQLKKVAKFEQASFDDVLDHDRDAMGDDLISVQEVTVNPGERLAPVVTRGADASILAAVALFREPSGSAWRAVATLASPDPQYCHRASGGTAESPAASRGVRFFLDENRIELR